MCIRDRDRPNAVSYTKRDLKPKETEEAQRNMLTECLGHAVGLSVDAEEMRRSS